MKGLFIKSADTLISITIYSESSAISQNYNLELGIVNLSTMKIDLIRLGIDVGSIYLNRVIILSENKFYA
jgi:hypothetical protein